MNVLPVDAMQVSSIQLCFLAPVSLQVWILLCKLTTGSRAPPKPRSQVPNTTNPGQQTPGMSASDLVIGSSRHFFCSFFFS